GGEVLRGGGKLGHLAGWDRNGEGVSDPPRPRVGGGTSRSGPPRRAYSRYSRGPRLPVGGGSTRKRGDASDDPRSPDGQGRRHHRRPCDSPDSGRALYRQANRAG